MPDEVFSTSPQQSTRRWTRNAPKGAQRKVRADKGASRSKPKQARPDDLTGFQFGLLTVEGLALSGNKETARWRCRCACGGWCEIAGGVLWYGKRTCCGCLSDKLAAYLGARAHEAASLPVIAEPLTKETRASEVGMRVRLHLHRLSTQYRPEECWPWAKSGQLANYVGSKRADKAPVVAHRAVAALVYGVVPAGLVVMHSCDNPGCCNPTHLSIGTYADNNDDRDKKGRFGRWKNPEARQALSQWARERWEGLSAEERSARAWWAKPGAHPTAKKVRGPDGSVWLNAALAAEAAGVTRSTMTYRCRKGLYGWSYID